MIKKITVFVLAMIVIIYGYNSYTEREKQRVIVDNMYDKINAEFGPLVENTTFLVGDTTYYFMISSQEFLGDPSSLGASVRLDVAVYENEIAEENLISDERFFNFLSIDLIRESTYSEYQLTPSHKSYYSSLFDMFTNFYYDIHYELNNPEFWVDKRGGGEWDESDAVLDTYGMVEKEGTAIYSFDISASGQKMTFDSEFTLKPFGEPVVIPLEITYPQQWTKIN